MRRRLQITVPFFVLFVFLFGNVVLVNSSIAEELPDFVDWSAVEYDLSGEEGGAGEILVSTSSNTCECNLIKPTSDQCKRQASAGKCSAASCSKITFSKVFDMSLIPDQTFVNEELVQKAIEMATSVDGIAMATAGNCTWGPPKQCSCKHDPPLGGTYSCEKNESQSCGTLSRCLYVGPNPAPGTENNKSVAFDKDGNILYCSAS